MIIRRFVVLFCSSAYFTATNGLYLNFAAPKAAALQTLQNEDAPHRDIDKWFRKGRTYHKKLIILDRKNKRVDDFVKNIISVIKLNDGNNDKLLNKDKRIVCRHMSFGSIYNSKAKRKRCKNPIHKRKQHWINFVIPIPIKKNIFSDSTRQGFSDDYLIDFNRRTDIDFDYYNTVHRAHVDSKPTDNDKETDANSKIEVLANARNEAPMNSRRITRFKIVPNNGDKPKDPTQSGSDNDDDTDTEDNNDSDATEDSDAGDLKKESDAEKHEERKEKEKPVKKIKDEWNDIINMLEVVKDSSEEREKHKRKNPAPSDKSDYDNKNNTEDYKQIEALQVSSGGYSDYDNSHKKESKETKPPELTEAQKKKKKLEEEEKKRIHDAWDIHDIVTDSSQERLRKKDKRKISETSGEEDSGDAEEINDGNEKDSHTERYVYMQGHRLYNNAKLDSVESRKMRIKSYFLPKRSIWDERDIKHLGAYWNSHELAAHN